MKLELTKNATGQTILSLNVYDLLHESLTDEEAVAFIESLSCHDAVIKHVTDQLITGWTENAYHGNLSTSCTLPLQRARIQIAMLCDDLCRIAITDLNKKIETLEKDAQFYRDAYYKSRG